MLSHKLVERVSKAMKNQTFKLYYQPIGTTQRKDNKPKKIVMNEILLRMIEFPSGLSPAEFIPVAENHGYMRAIDDWVIEETFRQICKDGKFKYSINLSSISVNDSALLKHIAKLSKKYSVDPTKICFEITETAAIANLHTAKRTIDGLKSMDFTVALDDFGGGYQKIEYIELLKPDYLKIVGTIVKDMAVDPSKVNVVKSLKLLADAFNIKTIAEYVENDYIWDILEELGIDYVQGFAIDHPKPLEDLLGVH